MVAFDALFSATPGSPIVCECRTSATFDVQAGLLVDDPVPPMKDVMHLSPPLFTATVV